MVTIPGIVLGLLCFLMAEPGTRQGAGPKLSYLDTAKKVIRIRSWLLCTLGMTFSTFVLGGIAPWMPKYIFEREARFQVTPAALQQLADLRDSKGRQVVTPEVIDKLAPLEGEHVYTAAELKSVLAKTLTEDESRAHRGRIFDRTPQANSTSLGKINLVMGGIVVVNGLVATLLGGWLGDKLRNRVRGSYFQVSGWSMIVGMPCYLTVFLLPFPYAWFGLFVAMFALFFNTGPMNTVLANVVASPIRASAFALNILIIHAFGDAVSPLIIGFVSDVADLQTALMGVSVFLLLSGICWVMGASSLEEDTRRAEG